MEELKKELENMGYKVTVEHGNLCLVKDEIETVIPVYNANRKGKEKILRIGSYKRFYLPMKSKNSIDELFATIYYEHESNKRKKILKEKSEVLKEKIVNLVKKMFPDWKYNISMYEYPNFHLELGKEYTFDNTIKPVGFNDLQVKFDKDLTFEEMDRIFNLVKEIRKLLDD